MRYKKEKLESLIRAELSKIIAKELEFENSLMTITEVETSDDLKTAAVNFSVYPSEKSKEVLKKLDAKHSYLYHLLRKKIRINMLPKIKFKIDTGIEQAAKIEKILIDENRKD